MGRNRIQVETRLQPLVKALQDVDPNRYIGDVFFDVVELGARCLHSVELRYRADPAPFEENEAAFIAIQQRYKPEQYQKIRKAFDMLPELLDPPCDALGQLFEAFEIANTWRGQYFTPYSLCKMMAMMTTTDIGPVIDSQGFISALEPACGSGAMMIALADAMLEAKFNPQTQLHVQATDIDSRCFYMTYVQLSLLHIPAIIHLGDSLSAEPPSRSWCTPAHAMGLWTHKLRRHYRTLAEQANIPPAVQEAWAQASPQERFDLVQRSGDDPASVIAGLVPFGVRELLDDGETPRLPDAAFVASFDLVLSNPPFGR